MAKDGKVQVWKFTQSQTLLLQEQARIHANELQPFRNYQQRVQNDLLNSFRDELGIPEGIPLNVDLDNLQFTLREEVVPEVPEIPADEAFTPVEEEPAQKAE